jgi:hypothetical protein
MRQQPILSAFPDRRKAGGRRQEAGGRRQEAGGRRQESENIFFALCQTGLKPLNLFMENKEICISSGAAHRVSRLPLGEEIQRPY